MENSIATSYVEYINRLQGVISSDVVLDGDTVTEVHVLSSRDRSPKQLVRDVQSIFYAKFHKKIDHKVVSVAQIDLPMASALLNNSDKKPGEISTTTVVSSQPRLSIEEVGLVRTPADCEVKVCLSISGRQFSSARHCDIDKSDYFKALSLATLEAVGKALSYSPQFSVKDVCTANIADETAVLVCICQETEGADNKNYCGSAFVTVDLETAVVKATLNAINRLVRRD